ncbi:MAG: pyridoxamine kinase [Clostridia bacterium]|nr:pyridoxamine kinase [Clostridia bacterium]
MERQKRVLAIHDISCFGRCSLTVALPIISAAGIECTVIPTAVLSTHTGGFTGFTFRDLTEDIMPIVEHWKTLDIGYDALYTGYLGSFEQIDIVSSIFDTYRKKDTITLVDPVMADNGKLYGAFGPDFPKGMKKLASKADAIVPNITEACFMLGKEYKEGPYTEQYIKDLLLSLADMGPEKVVLTGVNYNEKELGAATYDKKTDEFGFYAKKRIKGYYHGTGDVFGSALLSAMLKGKTLIDSATVAVDFTVDSIIRTYKAKTDIRFGVNFEEGLQKLAKVLK